MHPDLHFQERNTLLNKITNIDSAILNQHNPTLTKTILFGNLKWNKKSVVTEVIALWNYKWDKRKLK